jgi:hypothetical protein
VLGAVLCQHGVCWVRTYFKWCLGYRSVSNGVFQNGSSIDCVQGHCHSGRGLRKGRVAGLTDKLAEEEDGRGCTQEIHHDLEEEQRAVP